MVGINVVVLEKRAVKLFFQSKQIKVELNKGLCIIRDV